MFLWFLEDAPIRDRAAGMAVAARAIPPAERAALAALLRRRDAAGPVDARIPGSALGLVILAGATIFGVASLSEFAGLVGTSLRARAIAEAVLAAAGLGAILAGFAGLAWHRWLAAVPAGRYLFGTGIVEVAPSGLVRFIPAAGLDLRWTRRTVHNRARNSSRATWDLEIREPAGAVVWASSVSAGWTEGVDARHGAFTDRLSAQAARCAQLRSAGDYASALREDPMAWASRPDVWPTLSPALPAQPGRAAVWPLLVRPPFLHALVVALCVLPVGAFYALEMLIPSPGAGPSVAVAPPVATPADGARTRYLGVAAGAPGARWLADRVGRTGRATIGIRFGRMESHLLSALERRRPSPPRGTTWPPLTALLDRPFSAASVVTSVGTAFLTAGVGDVFTFTADPAPADAIELGCTPSVNATGRFGCEWSVRGIAAATPTGERLTARSAATGNCDAAPSTGDDPYADLRACVALTAARAVVQALLPAAYVPPPPSR